MGSIIVATSMGYAMVGCGQPDLANGGLSVSCAVHDANANPYKRGFNIVVMGN